MQRSIRRPHDWLTRLRWLRWRLPKLAAAAVVVFGAAGLWSPGVGDASATPAAVGLALITAGIALWLRDRGWMSWPQALAVLILVLQILVLLDRVPGNLAAGGWSSVLAGPIALALAGIALFSLDGAPFAAALLSAIVFTTGAVSVVGRLAGVPTPYAWSGLRAMTASSAVGLAFLGLGIVACAYRLARPEVQVALRWAQVLVVASVLSASLLLWLGLRSEAAVQRQRTIQAISHGLAGEVAARVRFMSEALERLAVHGGQIGGWKSAEDWATDARLTLSSFSGYRSVRWVDASLSTVLEARAEGASPARSKRSPGEDQSLRPGLEQARTAGEATVVAPVGLSDGRPAFSIVMPLAAVDQPEAFLVALFSFEESSFGASFENSAPGYDIALYAGSEEVLRRGPLHRSGPTASSPITLRAATAPWHLVAAPRPATLAQLGSHLPELALGAGVLVSFLLALILRLGGVAFVRAQRFERAVRERTLELEATLDELRDEVAARRRSESTLRLTRQVERTLAAELEPRAVMQTVTDAARELSGAQLAILLLPDGEPSEGSTGVPYVVSGVVDAALSGVARTDLYRWAARHHDELLLGLEGSGSPVARARGASEVERARAPGSVFGALLPARADTRRAALVVLHAEPGRFGVAEQELVSSLAAQAAIALDNAHLYAAEKAARNEAQTASAAKDRFMRTLSHELRNPLGSISNAVEALQLHLAGVADNGSGRMLGIVSRQVRHLKRMVEDLLDASRIESGKISLELQRLDLRQAVQDIAEDQATVIETAGLNLELELGDAGQWVDADPTRLAQTLGNLVSNAVKSTPPGGTVTISLRPEAEMVAISVRDTGHGVTPTHLPLLFEPFVQSEPTVQKGRSGLGLGLAIVRGLVQAHGGTVEARSDGPGRGAEFVVRLPARQAPDTHAPLPQHPETAGERRILIVDDHVDSAAGLAELLRGEGHLVETAEDATRAMQAAFSFRPDLVICDLGLPGIDGYAVARTLRADSELADVTLVALSGFGDDEAVRQAFEAGFDQHVTKPIAPDHLRRLVATASRRQPTTRSA